MRSRTAIVVVALAVGLAPGIAGASSAGEPKRYRVALVIEPVGAEGLLMLPTSGFRRALRELPVEGTVITLPARVNQVSGLRSVARRRYDLILSGLITQFAPLPTVAREFPDTWFATLDASRRDAPVRFPANVRGVAFREQEIGFVVGYLAGLMERQRDGPDVVASVGGMDVPTVVRFIAGFRAGARHANPRVRHVNVFTRNFVDPEACRAAANGVIAKGAGVVFQVAGQCGVGVLEAAAEHGVSAIGVDSDQSSYGRQVLTSAVKRFDLGVYRAIQLLVQGGFRPGQDTSLGIADGALALGRFSPRVPADVRRKTRRVLGQIARGEIRAIPATLRVG